MPQSKTTLVRARKIDGVCQSLNNLVYFVSHYQKSNLWLVKHSDLKKVLEITTSWKTGLTGLSKIAQNSNTLPQDEDRTAEEKEGIKI